MVAHTLSVSLDEFLGESRPAARGKRGPAPKWQEEIEAGAQLARSQHQFVARMIKTALAEAGAQ
jgi:hypothetical protein